MPYKPAMLARLLAPLAKFRHEVFYVAYLDDSGRLRGDELLSSGERQRFTTSYRRLFERAFELGTSVLVVAHNHPSGDARPSATDIKSTRHLQALARPLELCLFDHLIVSSCRVFSMRDAGLLDLLGRAGSGSGTGATTRST